MGGKCAGSKAGWWLVLVGALNWGLIGLGGFFGGNWNVVNFILGKWAWLESLVYVLVGVAGVMLLIGCRCKKCMGACDGCCGGAACAHKK